MNTGEVGRSHLFRGSEVVVHEDTTDGPLRLLFADGAEATAELLDDILTVDPYTTAAGTSIPAKVWPIVERSWSQDRMMLKLGARLPS
ncbi:hypothetical protein ACTI_54130 [Actinoplanes sp. OR16]|uniref:hypothetical protein n=1 Tax=Actinoplanes sp. OR16 TaxID=946334 RepID=UPI000F701C77|nr:hypothetical protein [Actinoplanes sp. OR16]BBH68728.1 hypothetical protein ACTI_54130 [Actinoplanes sp. OR16]